MSFLSRLFGTQADPRDEMRPLWFRVIELSRQPEYYATSGVADTVDGRFDMVVNVLSITMLRMEQSSELNRKNALLTELFVEDMDGQLRESGIGDIVVGKHMGRLMSALGGRLGALRPAINESDMDRLEAALERNVHWGNAPDPRSLALKMRALYDDMTSCSDEDLLAGNILR